MDLISKNEEARYREEEELLEHWCNDNNFVIRWRKTRRVQIISEGHNQSTHLSASETRRWRGWKMSSSWESRMNTDIYWSDNTSSLVNCPKETLWHPHHVLQRCGDIFTWFAYCCEADLNIVRDSSHHLNALFQLFPTASNAPPDGCWTASCHKLSGRSVLNWTVQTRADFGFSFLSCQMKPSWRNTQTDLVWFALFWHRVALSPCFIVCETKIEKIRLDCWFVREKQSTHVMHQALWINVLFTTVIKYLANSQIFNSREPLSQAQHSH